MDLIEVDISLKDDAGVVSLGDDFSSWRNDHGVSIVGQVWVRTGPVACHDEGLVLNGPGDEQGSPMGGSFRRPTGPDGEDLGSGSPGQSPEFREPEVIADEGAETRTLDIPEQQSIACCIVRSFFT